jgi:glycosyltransferase involved in cell wall biosynthesis
MDLYRIIIPTRNSSKWLKSLIQAYRKIEVSPLFIADTRSNDNTLEILLNEQADYITYKPEKDFCEDGMIEYGSQVAGTEWVLRLDDDEFPSKALMNWVENVAVFDKRNCWGMSRRDVGLVNGNFVYSRWPTRIRANGLHNPQIRMHRVNNVKYIHQVHSPGFSIDTTLSYAPNDCFFIHMNNVVRSFDERLAKVRVYASEDPVVSWQCVDECLWEVTDSSTHAFSENGLNEFGDLLKSLPLAIPVNSAELSREERQLMESGIIYSLRIHKLSQQALKEAREIDRLWFNMMPMNLLKIIAEGLLTISRALGMLGTKMFRNYDFRKNLKEQINSHL